MAKARQPLLSCKANNITDPKTKTNNNNNNNNNKKKSELGDFSESEIDAAEQLIQLSGDSDPPRLEDESVVSDCDTTHAVKPHGRLRGFFSGDGDGDGVDHRRLCGPGRPIVEERNKRFKSLSEIYSSTKPLPLLSQS